MILHSARDPYVGIKIQGGLGNQLFGVAAAQCLAWKLDVPVKVDLTIVERDPHREFQLDQLGYAKVSRRRTGHPPRFREQSFAFDTRWPSITTPVTLEGFFQSWKYFHPYSGQIRDLFVSLLDSTSVSSSHLRPFVAVHARRGDFLEPRTFAYHGVCSEGYFAHAIHRVRQMQGSLPAIVFSDDPNFAASLASLVDDATAAPLQPPLVSLAHMRHAQAHVISNSTFSWWSAWLAQSPTVVAPRPWFSTKMHSTRDLLPPHWITLGREL